MGLFDKKVTDHVAKAEINRLNAKIEQAEGEQKRKSQNIISSVVRVQLYRFQSQISSWKLGIENFEDSTYPTNEELIRCYNDAILDAHLSAIIEKRKMTTLAKDYKFVNESLEEDTATNELFAADWFRELMSIALDTPHFGYTLIQFGDRIGKDFKDVTVVPREYVNPNENVIRTSPSTNDGISYVSGKYAPWLLPVGRPSEMGSLSKATPLTIYKKAAIGSWADFTEIFGNPLRVGRTNIRDNALRSNMQSMLSSMGSTAWGVLDKDDEVEFIQTASTDAFQTFDTQIERMNTEMSKLILGSTMTVDSGSSRSQSEVHEKTTASFEKSDAMFLENWVNHCLIPFLNKHHSFNITSKFMFDNTETFSVKEQFEIDIKLAEIYDIPEDYITETYGTPVAKKEVPVPLIPGKKEKKEGEEDDKKSFSDKVRALYEDN